MSNILTKSIQNLVGNDKQVPEIISYKKIRKIIGILGMSLAFILWLGGILIAHTKQQPSISHYYYTNMREIFVGTMFSVAIFLFCYKGNSRLDALITNIAAIAAITVSLFPTDAVYIEGGKYFAGQKDLVSIYTFSRDSALKANTLAYYNDPALCGSKTPEQAGINHSTVHDMIHTWSATVFFVSLACMSWFIFTKSNQPKAQLGYRKKLRNITYRVCAIIMVLSMLFIISSKWIFAAKAVEPYVFWGEAVALFFFGVSWLVKGIGDRTITNPIIANVAAMTGKSTILPIPLNTSSPVVVAAANEFSPVCIPVSAGDKYQIEWSAAERWDDLGISAGADGYYNPFAIAKGQRVDAPCFTLCGCYNWDDRTAFPIGNDRTRNLTITIPDAIAATGYLSFFANDVAGFYSNNNGAITINVKRI